MGLAELAVRWRELARLFRSHADESVALAYERCAEELQSGIEVEEARFLTLKEAARWSGYTTDHLGRLIREGKIQNAGRKNRPLIRQGDLPIKPGHLPVSKTGSKLVGASKGQIVEAVVNSD